MGRYIDSLESGSHAAGLQSAQINFFAHTYNVIRAGFTRHDHLGKGHPTWPNKHQSTLNARERSRPCAGVWPSWRRWRPSTGAPITCNRRSIVSPTPPAPPRICQPSTRPCTASSANGTSQLSCCSFFRSQSEKTNNKKKLKYRCACPHLGTAYVLSLRYSRHRLP